jgi:hypothetical protein
MAGIKTPSGQYLTIGKTIKNSVIIPESICERILVRYNHFKLNY